MWYLYDKCYLTHIFGKDVELMGRNNARNTKPLLCPHSWEYFKEADSFSYSYFTFLLLRTLVGFASLVVFYRTFILNFFTFIFSKTSCRSGNYLFVGLPFLQIIFMNYCASGWLLFFIVFYCKILLLLLLLLFMLLISRSKDLWKILMFDW